MSEYAFTNVRFGNMQMLNNCRCIYRGLFFFSVLRSWYSIDAIVDGVPCVVVFFPARYSDSVVNVNFVIIIASMRQKNLRNIQMFIFFHPIYVREQAFCSTKYHFYYYRNNFVKVSARLWESKIHLLVSRVWRALTQRTERLQKSHLKKCCHTFIPPISLLATPFALLLSPKMFADDLLNMHAINVCSYLFRSHAQAEYSSVNVANHFGRLISNCGFVFHFIYLIRCMCWFAYFSLYLFHLIKN